MLVVISGSRSLQSKAAEVVAEFTEAMRDLRSSLGVEGPIEYMHGDARGVDRICGRLLTSHGKTVHVRPADWDRYGKAAGYRRNEQMARQASAVVVVWDGVSRGTGHMIDLARQHGVPVFVRIVKAGAPQASHRSSRPTRRPSTPKSEPTVVQAPEDGTWMTTEVQHAPAPATSHADCCERAHCLLQHTPASRFCDEHTCSGKTVKGARCRRAAGDDGLCKTHSDAAYAEANA